MTDIYVSHTGSDDGARSGYIAEPYRTVLKAFDNMTNADNVVRLLDDETWYLARYLITGVTVVGTTVTAAIPVFLPPYVGRVIWFTLGLGDGYGYRIISYTNPTTVNVDRLPGNGGDLINITDGLNINANTAPVFNPACDATHWRIFTSEPSEYATIEVAGTFTDDHMLYVGPQVNLFLEDIIFDGKDQASLDYGVYHAGAGLFGMNNCIIRDVDGIGFYNTVPNLNSILVRNCTISGCVQGIINVSHSINNVINDLNSSGADLTAIDGSGVILENKIYDLDVTGSGDAYAIKIRGVGTPVIHNSVTRLSAAGSTYFVRVLLPDASLVVENIVSGADYGVSGFDVWLAWLFIDNCLYSVTNETEGVTAIVDNFYTDPQFVDSPSGNLNIRNFDALQFGEDRIQLGSVRRVWIPPASKRSGR